MTKCVKGLYDFFKKDFIYLFPDRGEGKEKEKERERNISVWLPLACPLLGTWPATQACSLTGNQTSNHLGCRPAPNPLSHTSQDRTLQFLRFWWSPRPSRGPFHCVWSKVTESAISSRKSRFMPCASRLLFCWNWVHSKLP